MSSNDVRVFTRLFDFPIQGLGTKKLSVFPAPFPRRAFEAILRKQKPNNSQTLSRRKALNLSWVWRLTWSPSAGEAKAQ